MFQGFRKITCSKCMFLFKHEDGCTRLLSLFLNSSQGHKETRERRVETQRQRGAHQAWVR